MFLDLIEALTVCISILILVLSVTIYQTYKKNCFLDEILRMRKQKQKEISIYSKQLEEILYMVDKNDKELKHYVQDTMQILQRKNSKHFQQLKDIGSELIKRELNAKIKLKEVNKKPTKVKDEAKKIRLND